MTKLSESDYQWFQSVLDANPDADIESADYTDDPEGPGTTITATTGHMHFIQSDTATSDPDQREIIEASIIAAFTVQASVHRIMGGTANA